MGRFGTGFNWAKVSGFCYDPELITAPKTSHIQAISTLLNLGETILDLAQASPLAIQILDPPHRFHIADFPQIPLGGGEIGVPQDDLADDLHGDP